MDTVPLPDHETDRLARRALLAFVLTFIASRTTVFLVMSQRVPNMYFFLRGTHVHHLNYGIFLLAAVAAYLLFARPAGPAARVASLAYGVAMGLTFDEFGMWLHLGGSYWQRVSVDAVIVVAGVLGVIAFAPSFERLEARHHWALLARPRPGPLRVRPLRHRRADRDARRAAPEGARALVLSVASGFRSSRGEISSTRKEHPWQHRPFRPYRPFRQLRFHSPGSSLSSPVPS